MPTAPVIISDKLKTVDSDILAAEKGPNAENCSVPCTAAEQHDENLIDFEGADDPTDPLNWSSPYKWGVTVLISLMTLVK